MQAGLVRGLFANKSGRPFFMGIFTVSDLLRGLLSFELMKIVRFATFSHFRRKRVYAVFQDVRGDGYILAPRRTEEQDKKTEDLDTVMSRASTDGKSET